MGKQKCKALKEIRKQIADANDIPYVVSRCEYQGECSGTCPKCEEELQYLERELEKRRRRGKVIAITGISVGLFIAAASCARDKIQEEISQMLEMDNTHGAVGPVRSEDSNKE